MAQRKPILTWRRIAVLVLLESVVLSIVFYYHLYTPGLTLPPREQDRVHHPAGFSIIKPAHWKAGVGTFATDGFDSILIEPGNPRVRYVQHLSVRRLGSPADAEEQLKRSPYVKGTLLGSEAMIQVGRQGEYCVWQAMFQRDGHWYEISLSFPNPSDLTFDPCPTQMSLGPWQPFIESFHVEGSAASRPTSQPFPATDRVQ